MGLRVHVCHMYMCVCMYVLVCMYFNNNNNNKMNCVSSSSDIFIKSKIDDFVAAGSEVHSKNSHTEMHKVFLFFFFCKLSTHRFRLSSQLRTN